jgi:ABC-type multidrug transport system fused ATPase/permease subunit
VMDDGRLVEQGTHRDLLDLGGRYREMACHQLDLPPAMPRAA